MDQSIQSGAFLDRLNAPTRDALEIVRGKASEALAELQASEPQSDEEIRAWEAVNALTKVLFRLLLPGKPESITNKLTNHEARVAAGLPLNGGNRRIERTA